MKFLSAICLLGLVSCAHHRGPSSLENQNVAQDSMALGKVQAIAVKNIDKQSVCFDIDVKMKGVDQQAALPSNWTLAWIDGNKQYHLLNLSQRDPASVPDGGRVAAQYGEYQEWRNTFKTCAPVANYSDVKTLVLTPKSLPFKDSSSLFLSWDK